MEQESVRFLSAAKRFNYVTPRSFLELIAFYKELLADKREYQDAQTQRLASG